MSILSIFMIVTIFYMFRYIYIVARFIGESKVGLWHAFVNGFIRGNIRCRKWVVEYNIYYWSILVLVTLVAIALFMLMSFSENNILNRKEAVVVLSPILWFGLYKCRIWYHNKIKEFS